MTQVTGVAGGVVIAAFVARVEAAGYRVRLGEEQVVVFAEDGEALVPRLIETG